MKTFYIIGNLDLQARAEGVELTTVFTHIEEQNAATVFKGWHLWNDDKNTQFEKNRPTRVQRWRARGSKRNFPVVTRLAEVA